MGGRRDRHPRHQPVGHQRCRRRVRASRRRSDRSGDRRRARGVSRLVANDAAGAPRHPAARFDRDPCATRRTRAPALARRGQDAGRRHWRSDPRRPDLRLLRRRSGENSGREVRQRPPERRHRGHTRADRGRRNHCAVEFPDRDPGLEDRAGPRLRKHRGVQARRSRPRIRARARRDHRARRRSEGRIQSGCRAGLDGRPGDPRP